MSEPTNNPSALAEADATPERASGYARIGDFAAIGDGRTLGLVARDGSLDWLCLPKQDSPSIFGAALDSASGGRFHVQPAIPYTVERRYIERSNVMETDFHTARGTVRLTDAMTMELTDELPWVELVRRVQCLDGGPVPMHCRIEPRFDFGRSEAKFTRRGNAFTTRHGSLELGVQAWDAGELGMEGAAITTAFDAAGGSPALFALTASDSMPLALPNRDALERRLETSVQAWRAYLGRHTYDGPWTTAVERSLLVLKLLTDRDSGAITAAGSTSLPEVVGGKRNFDYRFGWVRDSAFAMDALMRVGMHETAHASLTWLLRAAGRTHPRLNPVYHLDATPLKGQQQLPLPGYRSSQPVLVGNQAGTQRQLGSWGDFIETVYLYVREGNVLPPQVGARLADCADLVAHIWRREDAGLWEIDDASYATSKMSCWLVFERVLELAEDGQVPSRHVARWRASRDDIRHYVETELWSEEKRSYLQKAGSDALDAGCLLAARRGFCDPRGERMNGTIDAIRRELTAGGPLLYRYSGMQEKENAFLACSFWMVEALAAAHRFEEAAGLMDELVELSTDIGLYSEEMEPGDKLMRGNIPQTLTHLSLINAAAVFEEARRSAPAQRG